LSRLRPVGGGAQSDGARRDEAATDAGGVGAEAWQRTSLTAAKFVGGWRHKAGRHKERNKT
jgi:hypothetical protein